VSAVREHRGRAPGAGPQAGFTPTRAGTLQRCPGAGTGPHGECAACGHDAPTLQRFAVGEPPGAVPPQVHQVLRSAGQPLDPAVRAEMESRLGHDFGRVRVHTDARAAESARAVAAAAYTVGRHVVFGPGQYAPRSTAGRRVLAHELAHVVQQGGAGDGPAPGSDPGTVRLAAAGSVQEREAGAAADRLARGRLSGSPAGPVRAVLQRQPEPSGLPAPEGQLFGINLSIDERGRVDVTASGPGLPVVGSPTLGVRRDPGGDYHLLVGAGRTKVSVDDIPERLRKLVGAAGKAGAPPVRQTLQLPPCRELRTADGARFMTYDEYRLSRMLVAGELPLPPAMYRARLESCGRERPVPPPAPPPAPMPPAPASQAAPV